MNTSLEPVWLGVAVVLLCIISVIIAVYFLFDLGEDDEDIDMYDYSVDQNYYEDEELR